MRTVYDFGPFTLDPRERTLRRDGRPVRIQAKPLDLLLLLVARRDQLVRKDEIFAAVWKGVAVADANLPIQINALRRTLGDDPDDPGAARYIETVPGHGYRFVARVAERELEPPSADETEGDRPRTALATGGAILIAVVVAGAAFLYVARPPRATIPAAGAYTRLAPNVGEVQTQSLETDGTRVYFSRSPAIGKGPPRLSAVAAHAGGAIETVWDEGRFWMRDISPRRSEALAGALPCRDDLYVCELWIVPLIGDGSPRRVGNLSAVLARWSPDGDEIAFTRSNEVFLARSDGSEARKLTTLAGQPEYMTWSPDQTRLRLTLQRYVHGATNYELWDVPVDGGDAYPVLPGWNVPAQERGGGWIADGRYYVFSSTRAGRGDLWLLDERRGWFSRERQARTPIRLTAGPLNLMTPLPSLDGSRLFAVGVEQSGELVRYDRTLGTFVRYLGGLSASQVRFSPDGEWISYIAYPERTLWLMRRSGSDKLQITFAPFEVDGHAWSPGGDRIAVHGRLPGEPFHIYLVPSRAPAPNTTPRRLTSRDQEEGMPTWSADGRRITFGDIPATFGQATGAEAIHVYDLDAKALSVVPGSKGLWTSRWSPDGRSIAALTIDRDQRLMIFDVAARVWRRTRATHVNDPTWSRDGAFVYYDTEGTPHDLRRYHVATDTVEQMSDFTDTLTLAWSGLAPDDSPLVLRNLAGATIYALDLRLP